MHLLNIFYLCVFFFAYFEGDNEVSETLDRCLECMHAQEVCSIPFDDDNLCQELGIVFERDLKCEIELLSFSKVQFTVSSYMHIQKFP